MNNQKSVSENLNENARKLVVIYDEFTESVKTLGSKAKGRSSSKFGGSFAHWVGGEHVVTDRESLCEKFLQDVQGHLELMQIAMEGLEFSVVTQACEILADILMQTVPASSNATTDLMKRAMIGQVTPFFPYVSMEHLKELQKQMETAYGKWKMLPVEKQVYKEVKRLIAERDLKK